MSWEQDFRRGFKVEALRYFYSKEHSVIGTGSMDNIKIKNIGDNGENLSFAVLSMNRSSLTIRLMNSVKKYLPNFSGEFVIGDNGSTECEKEALRQEMSKMPFKCHMIEFERNYGVAGGRNKLFAEIKTDWLLSADNDLYFVGNPLDKIQRDIATLGCHFLGLPLIDKNTDGTGIYGGHLYVENMGSQISIGGSTALISQKLETNTEKDPFLCTFLPGGVSVINKHTFLKCGGFDEEMFVGFEDTEFSVRLFQEGFKIGFAGIACIVHDHPKPEKKDDENYEKERFSRNFLKESAMHFEKKHNFCVWNPTVENWVEGRLQELLNDNSATKKNISNTLKPKIALVIDAQNWALDHVADQVIANLSQYYDFRRIYLSIVDNLAQVLLLAEDCQIVHFLWRPLASDLYSAYTQNEIMKLGMTVEKFREKFITNKIISVAVYDHLMLDESEDSKFTKLLFSDERSIVNFYTVSSNRLKKEYNNNKKINKKPTAITPDGVDLTLFKPINLERFKNISERTIKIGWVGNSKWKVGDLKGINTIIEPAIETLKKMGYNVELVTTDRQNRLIPHDEMPIFYGNIDLYICASTCEGTPNPILEAMACGIPVISTDVGIVPDCFGEHQMKYLLEERTVQCLINKIEKMINNDDEFSILSSENLNSIKSWDWTIMTNNFKNYFDSCLSKRED